MALIFALRRNRAAMGAQRLAPAGAVAFGGAGAKAASARVRSAAVRAALTALRSRRRAAPAER